MLVFADFETSGRNPEKDLPLELGIVGLEGDSILFERHYLFQWPAEIVHAVRDMAAPFVREMHSKNGLWDELLGLKEPEHGTVKVEAEKFDERLYYFAYEHWNGKTPRIAGFNPGFDLGWLKAWAPKFAKDKIHYGVFDVSTLRESVALVYPQAWGPSRTDEHRGVADCKAAIRYWQWYRANVMNPHHRIPGAL